MWKNLKSEWHAIRGCYFLQQLFYSSVNRKHVSSEQDAFYKDLNSELKTAKPFDQMPGHRSFPIIGTSWTLLKRDFTRFLDVHRFNWKKFGKIWRSKYPGLPQVVVTTCPKDVEKLFRAEGKFPERPGLRSVQHYRAARVESYNGSDGLLFVNGESWWKIRSQAQQALLKKDNLASYVPILGSISEEFINRIRQIRQSNNEMKPDFINEMYRWALESVALVGLNTRLGCLRPDLTPDSEAQKMIDAAITSFSIFKKLEYSIPIWKLFKTPTLKKLFEAQDILTDTTIKYIKETLAAKKNLTESEENVSILEQLLIRGMSIKDATVTVIDLFLAGIDTTSHTTGFLLYLLARNPDKQQKLRREVLSVVGPKGSPITTSALNDLQYLKACVKESLRMRPAAVGNARIIDTDLVLSGYHVPKGTLVVIPHQLMGEIEEYFPNPLEFIPERWIKGDPQESHQHPFTLLPFGYGTRMCIGRRLAELTMWQLTAKLTQNFLIEYHHQDIGCLDRTVNAPDQPLRFKFIDLPN